jgi:bifunctional DNA-binding transcriptional regulator/antitoxin component of YhaV-PrlF toxin-antitoxin module
MPQMTIISVDGSGAVVLPLSVMESAGLQVGDIVDITVNERQVILRPKVEESRRQEIEAITDEVFERRSDAYKRLA